MNDGIAVVIPSKNRAGLLEQTLRSVGEQSVAPAEVIVADDGSTDHTERVVEKFGARRIFNPAGDWGPSAARNAGLAAARTSYVGFIDSDDLYHPLALERLRTALDAHRGAPFSFGRALAARREAGGWESDGLIGVSSRGPRDILQSLYTRNSVPSGGALVRRECALAVGGFDVRFVFAEDHAFWLELARRADPVYVPEIVGVHRRHAGNRMTPTISAHSDEMLTGVAREDPRLAPCVPRRLGVLLWEMSSDATHQRSIRGLGMAAALLSRGPRRLTILRAAWAHGRTRRQGFREGIALLTGDPGLRAWLATY